VDSPLTTYITLACTSGVLNLFLCGYVLFKRHNYGKIATFFVLSTAATTIYCFGYAFSLTSETLTQMRFWSIVQYFGMPFAPPFGLLFVMQYMGMKLSARRITSMLIIPMLSLLLNATNDWHHWHYKDYRVHGELGVPFYEIEVGIGYVIHGCYTFFCMLASLLLLFKRWRETTRSYRPQFISLMGAQLIPMVTAFLYLVGVTPQGVDPVPMVVSVSSILFMWAIVSSRMLTIIPIAKETIFHSISDGVLVVGDSNRLVEYNLACQKMFPALNRTMYGQHLEQVWKTLFGVDLPFNPDLVGFTQQLEWTVNTDSHIYQVRLSPVQPVGNRRAGLLIIFTDMTELKRLQFRLEQLAYYDDLTRIYNRRAFFEQCERYFEESKSKGSPFTIVLFDIDHFKRVNDTYGHYIGDQVLVHVVQVCKTMLRGDMLFARYGGEEFVLALRGHTALEAQVLIEQIRREIASQPLQVDNKRIAVTSSFGIAETAGQPEATLQQLLHQADEALYASKRSGRNQSTIYRQDITSG